MFERYTERARQVVVRAQDEARRLKHNHVGTEHILLGLVSEDEEDLGMAARVLQEFGVTLDWARWRVRSIVGEGDEVLAGQIPFTPRAKKVLELSLREALSLGHNYIGTEHILLGLVRDGEGVAYRILLERDLDDEKIRGQVIRLLSRGTKPANPPKTASAEFAIQVADRIVDRLLEELRKALEKPR